MRQSGLALVLAVWAWAAGIGCATAPRPAIEPTFAARTYTPIRIALLPPDMFMVLDQVGANDPARGEALRQVVFREWVDSAVQAFRQRGYDLDLSARWDGIRDSQGQLLVAPDELSGMANAMLQFANGPAGGTAGPLLVPQFVAPDLAAKIGWATHSDSVLYVNLKGISTSAGKRTAQVVGVVFFVVLIALIVLAIVADGRGGDHGGSGGQGGKVLPGGGGRSLVSGNAGRVVVPSGRGPGLPPAVGPRRVYSGGGGPHFDVGIGVGVVVPLDGPVYTHEGSVEHEDEWFGGDQAYMTMTLVNAADGRVLWHLRESLDFDVGNPKDVQALVNRAVRSIPLRGDLVDAAAAAAPAAPATK
jgi:hypothetical protein